MSNVNVSDIIARAQQAADIEDDFISQATWLYWANIEHKKLYTNLARSGFPIGYSADSFTATGVDQYNLPEPLAIIGIRGLTTTGKYFTVPVVHPSSMVGLSGTTGIPKQCMVAMDPDNTNNEIILRFWPIPTSGTYIMDYITKPKNLVLTAPSGDDTNVVSLPNGWEERIVLGMARRALGKEETTNPAIEREIQDIDLMIEDSVRSYLLKDQPTVFDANAPTYGALPPYADWWYL